MKLYEAIKNSTVVKTNADDWYTPDYMLATTQEDLEQDVVMVENRIYKLDRDGYMESQAYLIVDPEEVER